MPRPLRILMISAEVETFARTGGLGDVVYGLSRALGERGAEVIVVTPRYGNTRVPDDASWWWKQRTRASRLGTRAQSRARRARSEDRNANARVCLLADSELFDRNGIYGDDAGTFGDNELRFASLSRGALAVAERAWGLPSEGGGPRRRARARLACGAVGHLLEANDGRRLGKCASDFHDSQSRLSRRARLQRARSPGNSARFVSRRPVGAFRHRESDERRRRSRESG